MNTILRNTVIGLFAATALAGVGLAPLRAMAGATVSAAARADKQQPINVQVSSDGFEAMRNVRAARVALFNGDTEHAKAYVRQAQQALTKAATDEKAAGTNRSGDPNLISIDGQLVVGEGYIGSPDKAAHLNRGERHLKDGNTQEAIEQLKLTEEDIGYTRLLMPLKETRSHVEDADRMMQKGDYFDANLALKSAEEGLAVETVMLVEVPKQANAATAASTATTPAKTRATVRRSRRRRLVASPWRCESVMSKRSGGHPDPTMVPLVAGGLGAERIARRLERLADPPAALSSSRGSSRRSP